MWKLWLDNGKNFQMLFRWKKSWKWASIIGPVMERNWGRGGGVRNNRVFETFQSAMLVALLAMDNQNLRLQISRNFSLISKANPKITLISCPGHFKKIWAINHCVYVTYFLAFFIFLTYRKCSVNLLWIANKKSEIFQKFSRFPHIFFCWIFR